LGSNPEAYNVASLPEQLEVLHDCASQPLIVAISGKPQLTLLRAVLGVKHAQLGKHPHVSSFQTQAALHQADNLVKVAVSLVQREQSRKLLGMDLGISKRTIVACELCLQSS
jgi:hypothetical protein